MKIRTEIKVALIAIAVIGVMVWGINFLKGRDIFGKEKVYYAVYKNINGLPPSSGIYVNGLRIGYVKSITYADPKVTSFLVTMAINSDIRIPINSVAKIYNSDILGSKALEIVMGDESRCHEAGDTLQVQIPDDLMSQVLTQVEPIIQKANSIMSSVDSITLALKNVFNAQAQAELAATLKNINTMSGRLSSASIKVDDLLDSEKDKLAKILTNVESISSNLKQNNGKLSNAIQNFSNISDTLAQANLSTTMKDVNTSLSSLSTIMKKIDKGEGNVGMLINNDSLYRNLEKTSGNLNALIEDIKANPKRYVKISVF